MDENIECKENWMLNALAESHLELLPGRLPFVSDRLVGFWLAGYLLGWLEALPGWLNSLLSWLESRPGRHNFSLVGGCLFFGG